MQQEKRIVYIENEAEDTINAVVFYVESVELKYSYEKEFDFESQSIDEFVRNEIREIQSKSNDIVRIISKHEVRDAKNVIVFCVEKTEYKFSYKHTVFHKGESLDYLIPINCSWKNSNYNLKLRTFKSDEALICAICKAVKEFIETSFSTKMDLFEISSEASEYIAGILKYLEFDDVEIVDGYIVYDNDEYGSYVCHSWVQLGETFIDVTADQFNPGMYEEHEFKSIIIQEGLPHGVKESDYLESI